MSNISDRIRGISSSISEYEQKIDDGIDICNCTQMDFLRHLRSRDRIDKAYKKIGHTATLHKVSALSTLTINIGDRFLTFPVWGGVRAIAFTGDDKALLMAVKQQNLNTLVSAIECEQMALYGFDCAESHGYQNGNALAPIIKSSPLKIMQCASAAKWFDVELYPTRYTTKSDLRDMRGEVFSDRVDGCDMKVEAMKVNLYGSFAQTRQSGAPIPSATFPILLISPYRPTE